MKRPIFIILFSILTLVGIFFMGYKVGTHKSVSTNICGDSIINIGVLDPIDTIDITYIDWRTILPHDTLMYDNAEEEYNDLLLRNDQKRQLLNYTLNCVDIIDALLYDGFGDDPDMMLSVDDIENALINNDYFLWKDSIDLYFNDIKLWK